jgi:hypothetical protein
MTRLTECPCGSGEYPVALHDGYNIFLCYACTRCVSKKTAGYRADIFERYECDEPIEPED